MYDVENVRQVVRPAYNKLTTTAKGTKENINVNDSESMIIC